MRGDVIVTGGAGLVGHAVRQRLEREGMSCMAVDLVPAEVEGRPVLGCDLVDMPRLRELTAGRAIAAIVHCGAMSGPNVGRNSPLQQVSVNIVGTANMLELGRELGVSRFVYASSVSAYGDCQGENLDEQTPLRPTNVYGATKAASEMLVMAYAADFRIPAVSLRLSMVYGPRRETACCLREMLLSGLTGAPMRLQWGHDLRRQPIHIDDAAAAVVAALKAPGFRQGAYNITGGVAVTFGEAAGIVRDLLPRADIRLGTGMVEGDNIQGSHSIAAAARDLGYRPQVELRRGLAGYADWLRDKSRPTQDGAAA